MTQPPASTRVALSCLGHPASVLAIATLLVNDHVLKGHAPGWLTEKLCDFAGLFVFPYLVALVLSSALSREDPRRIGRLAFGVTAVWFIAAKATSLGHDLTLGLVHFLLGPAERRRRRVEDSLAVAARCRRLCALRRHRGLPADLRLVDLLFEPRTAPVRRVLDGGRAGA